MSRTYSHRLSSFLALALLAALSSCAPPVEIDHQNIEGFTERTEARLAIEGMMCEIACVAKVKKELLELHGVAETRVDFKINSPVDTAYISFDPSKVDAADMVRKVEAIGNGLYQVLSVKVVHYAPSVE